MTPGLWQNEKKRLSDYLIERIICGRDSVAYHEIAACDYPAVFKLSAKKHAQLLYNRYKPLSLTPSPYFLLTASDVRQNLAALETSLFNHVMLQRADLIDIIRTSVGLEFDLIVRPHHKLMELLFKNHEILQRQDILAILQGLSENRPYIAQLIEEVDSVAEEYHRSTLSEISRAVEASVYRDVPLSAFLLEVRYLLDFESDIMVKSQAWIKSEVVLGMLEERGLDAMKKTCEAEAGSKAFWTVREIESALERHLLVGGLETLGEPDAAENGSDYDFIFGDAQLLPEADLRGSRRFRFEQSRLEAGLPPSGKREPFGDKRL
jgi:hypothetical protein